MSEIEMSLDARIYETTMKRLRKIHPDLTDKKAISYLADEIQLYREKIQMYQDELEKKQKRVAELEERPERYDDELRMCKEELRVCNSDREMLKDTIVRMAMQLTGGGR